MPYLPALRHPVRVVSQLFILFELAQDSSFLHFDRPVDKVEVQVVQLEVPECGLAGREHILYRVLRVPDMSDIMWHITIL